MALSFNVAKFKASPRLPSVLPTTKPSLPQNKLYLTMHEKMEGGGADEEVNEMRRDRGYGRERRRSVFERLFGMSFGTGRRYRKRSIGGWFFGEKRRGFDTSLAMLRRERKNWSQADRNLISRVVEEVMNDLPQFISRQGEHRGLPPYARKKIMSRLWEEVKKGNLSHVNFEDAEMIIEQMEV